MDMYDSLFSEGGLLNEQLARQIFEIFPDQGPIMVIMDREGNSWPSDSEKFSSLNLSDSFVKDLLAKIDDGVEPIITQVDDISIIASQLVTDRNNCGYVIMALPQYSPESTLINIDLIEILLNQISLIAKLIEKNTLLYEHQRKHHSIASQYYKSETAMN